VPYFISDKGLILETVKFLVSGTHEGFRSTSGISLNNLNTEEKKSCRSAVKISFNSTCRLQQKLNVKNNIIFLYLKVLLRKTTLNG
jgi:hypothetical protein